MVAEPAFKLSFMPFVVGCGFISTEGRSEVSVYVGRGEREDALPKDTYLRRKFQPQGLLHIRAAQRSQMKASSKKMEKGKGH